MTESYPHPHIDSKDIQTRLESFQKHGILPASQVLTEGDVPTVIPSAEQQLLTSVSTNYYKPCNLTPEEKDRALEALTLDGTVGFINMALERSQYTLIRTHSQLRREIEQRLLHSAIFIFEFLPGQKKYFGKVTQIPNNPFKPATKGIKEISYTRTIERNQFRAILIPEPLIKTLDLSAFRDIQIIPVPMVEGRLSLSGFTLATVISREAWHNNPSGLTPEDVTVSVNIPDYQQALRDNLPNLPKKFGTHITRFGSRYGIREQTFDSSKDLRIIKFSTGSPQLSDQCTFTRTADQKQQKKSKPTTAESKQESKEMFSGLSRGFFDRKKSTKKQELPSLTTLLNDTLKEHKLPSTDLDLTWKYMPQKDIAWLQVPKIKLEDLESYSRYLQKRGIRKEDIQIQRTQKEKHLVILIANAKTYHQKIVPQTKNDNHTGIIKQQGR